MTPLGPVEVAFVCGRRGSGKTTLARRLLGDRRRVVVFDPLGEWCTFSAFRGGRADTLVELRELLKRRWHSFRVAYVPEGDLVAQLDGLARFLWEAQAPYPACGTLALVIDEANLGIPNQRLRAGLAGMSKLTLQGRHRGVALLAISQRPALVSVDFRGSAHRTFAFALPAPQDRQALAAQLGRAAQQLGALPDRRFIVEQAGLVTTGSTAGVRARLNHAS